MRTTDTPTGALLGDRYLLLRPLGHGGSASVYLAEDQSLRREVAVKVLRTGLGNDDAFRKRFRAEAVAVAGLNHPHVLRVFDWGEADGDAWLVTEYLAGGSLRTRLDERGRLPVAETVAIGAQAADGLAYAHAQGFVHRDVKPANLLFDDTGRVRIADFGVARALAEAQWTEPSDGLIGTVRYTSPEQAQGHAVDGKADVYSLALVLYECVTGEVPFAADTQVATLNARIGATLPFHPALGELEEVLRAAADPDPRERLAASELLRRLDALGLELAGAGDAPRSSSIGFVPPSPEELTGPHRTVGRGAARAQTRVDDVTEVGPVPDATVVGAAIAPAASPPGGSGGPSEPTPGGTGGPPPPLSTARRRRRWPVVLLVAALLAAGVGAWLVVKKPFAAATYPVPLVINSTIDHARSVLAADHGMVLRVDSIAVSRSVAYGLILKQEPAANVRVAAGTVVHVVESGGPPPVAVPTVVGKTCSVAVAALRHAGFTATCPPGLYTYAATIPRGMVVAVYVGNTANPTSAAYGAALQLQLSKGPPPQPVPNVTGLAGLVAVTTLRQSGFAPFVVHEFDRQVHAGNVVSTSPASGGKAQPGTAVKVVVSYGAPATVPSLGHASLADAEAIIVRAGLTVLSVHGSPKSHLWTTQPSAGTVVAAGSAVVLYGS